MTVNLILNGFLILQFVCVIQCVVYTFLPGNLYAKCQDSKTSIKDFFDTSDLIFDDHGDYEVMHGDMINIWDVEPDDRIEFIGELLMEERGSFQKTMFNVRNSDVCSKLYTKGEVLYDFWTINVDEEYQNCFNQKGAILRYSNMSLIFSLDVNGDYSDGVVKMQLTFSAFDKNNKKRNNEICFAIQGDLYREDED